MARAKATETIAMRFSIRDILWLTAVVAILVAWGVDRSVTNARWQLLRERHPMIYNTMTGEHIDTNNLRNVPHRAPAPNPPQP